MPSPILLLQSRIRDIEATEDNVARMPTHNPEGAERKKKLLEALRKRREVCEKELLLRKAYAKSDDPELKKRIFRAYQQLNRENPKLYSDPSKTVADPCIPCITDAVRQFRDKDVLDPPVNAQHQEGREKLRQAAKELRSASKEAFPSDDYDERQREADQIISAFREAWNQNYGKGNNGSGDNVGGYLCWDWSRSFEEAAKRLNLKHWTVTQKMVHKEGSNVVHFYVEIRPKGASGNDGVRYIDDGWFNGEMIHSPEWPPSRGWKPGTWKPPADKYSRPPIKP